MKANDKTLFTEANKYIPGGVNSPFRTFDLVGGYPVFMSHAKGSKIYDTDGKSYIDYSLGWGAIISGHAHPKIQVAIKRIAQKDWCYGTPTVEETTFAKSISKSFPSMQKVRLANSGTEAVMTAIRLARGYTKKDGIIIFKGSYHGHSNDTLVKADGNKKLLTSTGVPKSVLHTTHLAEYNNIASVEQTLKSNSDIAAVLIEPVAGNMGVVIPQDGFLKKLQKLCKQYKTLLIFDEVISGFGVPNGGAQNYFKVFPDITVLGKSLAGGLPVGAIGGGKEIMNYLAPKGPVYSAGTFSGNPMTVQCGLAALELLGNNKLTKPAEELAAELCNQLKQFIKVNNLPVVINQIGQIFSLFFNKLPTVANEAEMQTSDFAVFAKYHKYLLDHGIYLSPSGEDTCFVSLLHSKKDINYTYKVIVSFLKEHYKVR